MAFDKSPKHIEMNYDADLEDVSKQALAPDARVVSVDVAGRKMKLETLQVSSPEDPTATDLVNYAPSTMSTFWAGNPAASGAEPCPLKIQPGSVHPRGDAIEFRAELDTSSLRAFWGTVENAAAQEWHPILFKVEVEQPPEREQRLGKLFAKRRGLVRINLNSIRWKWTPLERDEKGGVTEGAPQTNTPIQIKLDTSGRYGFRLELERRVRQKDDTYGPPQDSDFTHYLAPDGKLDMNVLAMEPLPWDPKIQPTQQITTTWWTQKLPADHPLLQEVQQHPVRTTIRTQAFAPHSITRRYHGTFDSDREDNPPLAIREIPLVLGLRKWRLHLVSPDPSQPPVLLQGKRPWEHCVDVELEIADKSDPEAVEYMRNTELDWSLHASNDSHYCGKVSYQETAPVSSGSWRTDENGRIKFRFLPERENAVFLGAGKEGGRYYAEFDVRQKGTAARPGELIRLESSSDETPVRSFLLDWAPKFDLGILKLPFFVKDATLDLEAAPGGEPPPAPGPPGAPPAAKPGRKEAKPIPVELPETDSLKYRQLFRCGGTLHLGPTVSWDPGEGKKTEFRLLYYALVVGEEGRTSGEERKSFPVEPGGGIERWPEVVTIPAEPGQTAKGEPVRLKPEVPLHPDIAKFLHSVRKEASQVQSALATSSGLPGTSALLGRDAEHDFRVLGRQFGERGTQFFAESPQDDLVPKAKALQHTLSAMPMFVIRTRATWEHLALAIDFHRQAYKRWEEAMMNFYYDFVLWKPVKDILDGCWKKLSESKYFSWVATLLEKSGLGQINSLIAKPMEYLQKGFLGWLLKNKAFAGLMEDVKKKLGDSTAARTTLQRGIESIEQQTAAAHTGFQEKISQFIQHADTFEEVTNDIRSRYISGRAAGQSPEELRQLLQPLLERREAALDALAQAQGQLKLEFGQQGPYLGKIKSRVVTECQLRGEQAREQTLLKIDQHLEQGRANLDALLKKDVIEDAEVVEALEKLKRVPEPSNLRTALCDDGLAVINQQLEPFHQDYNRLSEKLRQLHRNREQLRLPDFPAPPLASPRGRREEELLAELASLDKGAANAQAEAEAFCTQAKGLLDRRVSGAAALWLSQRDLIKDTLDARAQDGSAAISHTTHQHLDTPPAPPSGMLESLWEQFKGFCSRILDLLARTAESTGALAWFIWTVKQLLRLLFTVIKMLFHAVARMLAKICEFMTAGLNLVVGRNGWVLTSSLCEPALTAGVAAFESSTVAPGTGGEVSQSSPEGLGEFFNFPYWREQNAWQRFQLAVGRYSPSGRTGDEMLAAASTEADEMLLESLRTGYEDYYPTQVKQARSLLFCLCRRVLSVEMLQSPPCQEDPGPRTLLIMNAADKVKGTIHGYMASVDSQQALSDQGFFKPFWRLQEGNMANSMDLDAYIGWIGWIIGTVCRVVAVVLTLFFFWTEIALPVAALLLVDAALVDTLVAALRMTVGVCGYYPYATAYPRDVVALQGIHFALLFEPEASRFGAKSVEDIIRSG